MIPVGVGEIQIKVGERRWFARLRVEPGAHRGAPVVLVHGFGVSSAYFVPFAEKLGLEYDVYAPDLPGHGKSDRPAHPLDIAGFADALGTWLAALGIERSRLIGHSMGCQIVVELAQRRPDLVDRLVLIGPTVDARVRSLPRTLPRFIAGGLKEPPGMGLLLLKDYVRARRALITELKAMFAYPLEEAVARLDGLPLLLVRGEHDLVAPDTWLAMLARRAPGAEVVVVPDTAHAVQFAAPDELARRVRPFLDASDGATRPAPGEGSHRPDSGSRTAPR